MWLVPQKRFHSVLLSIFILIAAIPLLTSGCAGNSGFGRKNVAEKKQEQFYTGGMKKIILNNRNGNISLNVWDRNEVKFEVVRRLKGYESIESLEEQLQEFKFEVNQNNDVLIMDAGYAGDQKNIDGLIDISVFIPSSLKSAEANLALGNLHVKDFTGAELKAVLHIGNIELSKFDGRLDADVNTGNIRVVSGKLADGTILRTYIGTIDTKVELDEKGKYQFFASMGNVELKLPAATNIVATGKNSFFANDFSDRKEGARAQIDVDMGRVTIRKY